MMIQRLPVILSEEALADLQSIAEHIFGASGSENIAYSFAERIKRRRQKIGDAPRGGRARDDIHAGLRTVPFERSAVIVYVIEDQQVRITNVFYGGRDFESLLHDRGTDA